MFHKEWIDIKVKSERSILAYSRRKGNKRTEMRESRATLLKIEEENKQTTTTTTTTKNTALSVNIDEETA